MNHYVGLDVSMKSTFICVINNQGEIIRESELSSSPESIGGFLKGLDVNIEKIGLESGSLTHYLTKGLREMGFSVIPMESRKMAAILATTINKNDKNDARGIAFALKAEHYQECVHRTDEAMNARTLLNGRQNLVRSRTQVNNSLKGLLKPYGIKLGKGREAKFEDRVLNIIKDLSEDIQTIIISMLNVLKSLDAEIDKLNRYLKEKTQKNEKVKLLLTMDGIGPVTAFFYLTEIDNPERFEKSKNVGAYLGLTPRQYSSGEINKQGRISKRGCEHTRYLLVEAATVLLTRCKTWSSLKAWGMKLWKKSGKKKAIVAVARKMSVILYQMLITETPFKRGREEKQNKNVKNKELQKIG